jgi:hypothetical protein
MCDNALLTGMAMARQPVDREIVNEVCRDFDLRSASESAREVQHTRDPSLPWTSGPVTPDREPDAQNVEEPEEGRRILFGSRKA